MEAGRCLGTAEAISTLPQATATNVLAGIKHCVCSAKLKCFSKNYHLSTEGPSALFVIGHCMVEPELK